MTCLCLTRNRRSFLPRAIQCFQEQTYPNRELLILSDGVDVRDLVPEDERIRLVAITEGSEIGAKRNFGCEQANGEIIAHWDDDDHSAPGRLADQVQRMLTTGLSVTGYHSMRFKDGAEWWQYVGATTMFSLGTALMYRKEWWQSHPFRALQVGEDNDFVHQAVGARALIAVDAGDLMWASIHQGNTSPKQMSGSNWNRI